MFIQFKPINCVRTYFELLDGNWGLDARRVLNDIVIQPGNVNVGPDVAIFTSNFFGRSVRHSEVRK